MLALGEEPRRLDVAHDLAVRVELGGLVEVDAGAVQVVALEHGGGEAGAVDGRAGEGGLGMVRVAREGDRPGRGRVELLLGGLAGEGEVVVGLEAQDRDAVERVAAREGGEGLVGELEGVTGSAVEEGRLDEADPGEDGRALRVEEAGEVDELLVDGVLARVGEDVDERDLEELAGLAHDLEDALCRAGGGGIEVGSSSRRGRRGGVAHGGGRGGARACWTRTEGTSSPEWCTARPRVVGGVERRSERSTSSSRPASSLVLVLLQHTAQRWLDACPWSAPCSHTHPRPTPADPALLVASPTEPDSARPPRGHRHLAGSAATP